MSKFVIFTVATLVVCATAKPQYLSKHREISDIGYDQNYGFGGGQSGHGDYQQGGHQSEHHAGHGDFQQGGHQSEHQAGHGDFQQGGHQGGYEQISGPHADFVPNGQHNHQAGHGEYQQISGPHADFVPNGQHGHSSGHGNFGQGGQGHHGY